MEDSKKIDDLQKIRIAAYWDSLKRFDSYITATNFKCGLITTFNAAVFGGVILKIKELPPESSQLVYPIYLIATIIFILSILSIYNVVITITPRLKGSSNHASAQSPSLFFFSSISEKFTPDSYFEKLTSTSIEKIERDLASQVHEVATITSKKMKTISRASTLTSANLFFLFLLALMLIIDKLGLSICSI